MSRYSNYKHLLGRKYVDGKQDCYGLVMGYLKDVHSLPLKNFARPTQFWANRDFDLINNMLGHDGWQSMGLNTRNLQIGDVLIFAIHSTMANHLGVYVGNGMMIHHLYQRLSNHEAITQSWTSRLLMIVRHPDVRIEYEKKELIELLPPHVKRTLRIDS